MEGPLWTNGLSGNNIYDNFVAGDGGIAFHLANNGTFGSTSVSFTVLHISGANATEGMGPPSVTVETAAGSGATASIVRGGDLAGRIEVDSGTGTTTGKVATLLFARSLISGGAISLTPANASAASLGHAFPDDSITGTSGFSVNVTSALSAGTTYLWDYVVIGSD